MDSKAFHQLIKRAQNGDAEAMNEFLALIRPYFEQIAKGYEDPAHASRSVSDLVQEAEIQVWNHLEGFEGSENKDETLIMFRAWVSKIIKSLALTVIRKRATQKRGGGRKVYSLEPLQKNTPNSPGSDGIDPEALQTSASAKFFSKECEVEVRSAIDEIPEPENREILNSIFFQGRSLRNTASLLGLNYSEVRTRYLYLISILEKKLSHLN